MNSELTGECVLAVTVAMAVLDSLICRLKSCLSCRPRWLHTWSNRTTPSSCFWKMETNDRKCQPKLWVTLIGCSFVNPNMLVWPILQDWIMQIEECFCFFWVNASWCLIHHHSWHNLKVFQKYIYIIRKICCRDTNFKRQYGYCLCLAMLISVWWNKCGLHMKQYMCDSSCRECPSIQGHCV